MLLGWPLNPLRALILYILYMRIKTSSKKLGRPYSGAFGCCSVGVCPRFAADALLKHLAIKSGGGAGIERPDGKEPVTAQIEAAALRKKPQTSPTKVVLAGT